MIDDNAILKNDIEIVDDMEESTEQKAILPKGFVYITDISPSIKVDLKYATTDNFTTKVVPGYNSASAAIATKEAAIALKNVQNELNTLGLGLKVFDSYRPHRAAQYFKKWCLNGEDDPVIKARFYPDIKKADLLNGYIAEHSGHSRGSTIDVTAVNLETGKELDMGTEFDFLGEESHTKSTLISDSAQANRQLLVDVMDKHGFDNYRKEWWHFELRDEPFKRKPEDHFDFVVE